MGEFINVLVSKGKSNLIPEKDNLYGQFVGEWDFEWVDNQGTTGERHVQGEWIFGLSGNFWLVSFLLSV